VPPPHPLSTPNELPTPRKTPPYLDEDADDKEGLEEMASATPSNVCLGLAVRRIDDTAPEVEEGKKQANTQIRKFSYFHII
jgi:hypothetical protein